ncbi:hypothetical protein [Marinactinospora rubrisoli]|uniref:Major facilitator superfamily (MFS) profile domain-containing protein n=1 Tax=Marinactinospora rubrisoli TaxID=2715399 RepID=A0ABW2KDW2_9ACTN
MNHTRTTSLRPAWQNVAFGALVGLGTTVVVGLIVDGAGWVVNGLTADQVIGANIGLGLATFAARLVGTPLAGWWLLRLLNVPRPGAAALIGAVAYVVMGWSLQGDPALPGAILGWLILGPIAGAAGVFAAGLLPGRAGRRS